MALPNGYLAAGHPEFSQYATAFSGVDFLLARFVNRATATGFCLVAAGAAGRGQIQSATHVAT
jgi:hypothetical protein